jgi:hypothetical protein
MDVSPPRTAAHADQACRILPQIWASLSWYVMVKWGDWGCRPNPYSSHINVIYVKGVWQPFMCCGCAYGFFPTTYCRSCRPSFWNFVRNLGYSQAIPHGEMRWLRLQTQPIFISHPYYIYKRCLTTFICCGCAYGCVPTTLRLLMPTKLVEFCHKSGQVSADMWWWNEVIEAVDPTHIHLTSILYI